MTPPLHVVQTVASLTEASGGPARTVRDLSEALARGGARVTIVAAHDGSDAPLVRADPALVTTRLVPVRRRLGVPTYAMAPVLAELATGGPTLVHDNGLWSPAHIAATAAARRLALPLVISPHGMLEPWALAWHGRRKRLALATYERRFLAEVSGLLATAPSEAAAIRALVPGPPIATIANGVACPPDVPDRRDHDTPQPRTLLFLSRLHPKKNLPGLVAAFASIAAAFPDWTLVMAGPDEGGHAAVLAATIARLDMSRRIDLRGAVAEADKAALFAACDLFVLPSFSENFGIVVAEALAAGVPVVASTGTPWAVLADQACGWQAGTEPAALAAVLADAMRLPAAERRAMGKRGHALVKGAFGWDGIAARMRSFYDWLLAGRLDGSVPDFIDRGEIKT
jgi:glycosyltransferase involved in cell wall biosynthesis